MPSEYQKQRINERLKPFRYLWKVDDPDWRKKRNADWKTIAKIYDQESPRFRKCLRLFFMEGVQEEVFDELTIYLLTPVTSKTVARKYVLSSVFLVPYSKEHLLTGFFMVEKFSAAYWYRDHSKYLSDAFLGSECKELRARFATGKIRSFTPSAKFFCYGFLAKARMLFTGKINYCGYIECVDYFIATVEYADRSFSDTEKYYNELFELAAHARKSENVSEDASYLASQIIKRKKEITSNWKKGRKGRKGQK